MNSFNIHISGVGGQGVGLLSEIILRAADHGGHHVKSVDTHGLAQRGGVVVSQIRIGDKVFSPLIPAYQADLAISLERHEAMRASAMMVKDNGRLIYYDTVWQPLPVRLNEAPEVTAKDIQAFCRQRGITVESVFQPDLPDIRMQNIALLATICMQQMVPGIAHAHYLAAMGDLLAGAMHAQNSALFEKHAKKNTAH
jgi:indolepyruvate ferredoxin oxidoreductase beta subunit